MVAESRFQDAESTLEGDGSVTVAPTSDLSLARYRERLREMSPLRFEGRVVQVIGLSIEVEGLRLQVGEICHIHPESHAPRISAEVLGFRNDRLILMPFSDTHGVRPGSTVLASGRQFRVPVGDGLLGRVIDGLGRPIDGAGTLLHSGYSYVARTAPAPLERTRIVTPLVTGVRAIDGLLTCGKGQRMGIFAGSGVGKSTLLGMIARRAQSDVNVIALIGERGREVKEFMERDLGQEGLERSVVVVSTSDQPALQRLKGAWVATAIAEDFRDRGYDVTFMMDSVTRFAMAQREIGLTIGEPPALKGYPPSVFAMLPQLMERAGTSAQGTITGFYTVLVEGDDLTEPVADTARSILDGHIALSRELASSNHYPAIEVLGSVSRLMPQITHPAHLGLAGRLRDVLAVYQRNRDLVTIGAYVAGTNPELDDALLKLPRITALLRQRPDESSPLEDTIEQLAAVVGAANG